MSSRKSLLLEKRNTGTGGRVGIQVDNCSRISSDFLKNVQPWEVTSFGGRPRAPSNFSDHSAHFRMDAAGLGMSDTLTEEFCRNTSLHGLKYIGQRRFHFVEKFVDRSCSQRMLVTNHYKIILPAGFSGHWRSQDLSLLQPG